MVLPQNGWFIRESPYLEMDDDWGYPYFRKPPNRVGPVTGIPSAITLC